ncbi:extracellular triacylglycerol [Colletotrichum truncatum]|uniref:Extracellular triacylglycerol n=1 Tax=Colletotrichum truncatum TaxID=5467 RepID=A0ACC3Z5E4_COLTU|nr:extracellular triacylglycerol [Colletotrichum truncatum]KAF6795160.1 extracellular triacylglycerol [Colletotrichum truncatum]
MRRLLQLAPLLGLLATTTSTNPFQQQQPLLGNETDGTEPPPTISVDLFRSLERTSRIVDITYCVGNSGISQPFSCVSRCKEFPSFNLVTTWNTGLLLSDSCGYIAVDHGVRRPGDEDRLGGEVGERAIIVAFRGTYSITNTVVDLSTVPQEYVPYPAPDDGGEEPPKKPEHRCEECTVHMGFLASWRQARKLVLPHLKKLREQYPDYPIHLVGHSLGGAVAMLASLELKVSLGWDNVIVTTFGEPKVGNQGLCDYVDAIYGLDKEDKENEVKEPPKRTYRRVTHAGDPVPLLPLTEWGYKPHAGEIYISKSELSPSIEDVVVCHGDSDSRCITKGDGGLLESRVQDLVEIAAEMQQEGGVGKSAGWMEQRLLGFPSRLKLWQLFFAHRDYFWRLGLCVPGGDPANWGRDKYGSRQGGKASDEL